MLEVEIVLLELESLGISAKIGHGQKDYHLRRA